MDVDAEVELLRIELARLAKPNDSGQIAVRFKTLMEDDHCANTFEALVGTLKAAKKRKVVSYDSELLLAGVHDDVEIVLLQAPKRM